MKKFISALLLAAMLLGITACGTAQTGSDESKHLIGVLTYSLTDGETSSFREYLENYIEASFEDVDFLYSDNVTSKELELEAINAMSEAGVEGIMSFISFDLAAELDLCSSSEMYYMMASGTIADTEFEANADNPWFLGVIGPGRDIEYQAGYQMAAAFADQGCRSYMIITGGAAIGNEMHMARAEGMRDALENKFGAELDFEPNQLQQTTTLSDGDLTVTLCPGYFSDELISEIKATYDAGNYDAVMSVLYVAPLADKVIDSTVGAVDCYDAENNELYQNGKLDYLTGKYESIIAPSFAAMYNAVTGYAEQFRDSGRAFRLTQGFWTSADKEDFDEKYAMSSGIALNAYSYDDLLEVIAVHNSNASLKDLQDLAEAYDFESAQARRS